MLSLFEALSDSETFQILLSFTETLSQVAIVKRLKRSCCAVQTTIKLAHDTEQLKNRPGRGRKRKTTVREDRWLGGQVLLNCQQSA